MTRLKDHALTAFAVILSLAALGAFASLGLAVLGLMVVLGLAGVLVTWVARVTSQKGPLADR